MKLYEYHEAFLNILALFDNPEVDEETITYALQDLNMGFEAKCENIAKWSKSLLLEAEAIKLEEQRLAKRRKALECRAESNKRYMEDAMRLTGKMKFSTPLFSFNISNNPQSLRISDDAVIPSEFLKVTTTVDKKELLAAVKNGLVIDGVEAVQTSSLKIR